MTEASAEAKAAAAEIVKAASGTGEQFDFDGWPASYAAVGSVLVAGLGIETVGQARDFWRILAEAIDAMPWQGRVPEVIRRDAAGRVLLEPQKTISVSGAATNAIITYAAAQAGIDTSALPWKMAIEVRPGKVRAYLNGKLSADVPVTPAAEADPLSGDYGDYNEHSAAKVAFKILADRRRAGGSAPC